MGANGRGRKDQLGPLFRNNTILIRNGLGPMRFRVVNPLRGTPSGLHRIHMEKTEPESLKVEL